MVVDSRTSVDTKIADGARHVQVDLKDVTFVDSSGINLLLKLRRRADELGATMTILSASDRVRYLLTVTGLADYFGIEPFTK